MPSWARLGLFGPVWAQLARLYKPVDSIVIAAAGVASGTDAASQVSVASMPAMVRRSCGPERQPRPAACGRVPVVFFGVALHTSCASVAERCA